MDRDPLLDRGPLRAPQAKSLMQAIVATGAVIPTRHFKEELKKDHLTIVDAENVLRGGVVREAEWENGSWRYRVETPRICVVVAFADESTLVLVTAMRHHP